VARRGQSRKKLIAAAYGLFRAGGVHGTSLAEVTAAAGMPRGSFSFHFPGGKDELTHEVLRLAGTNVRVAIGDLAAGRSFPEVIDALFVAVRDELVNSCYRDSCAVAGVTLDVHQRESPDVVRACAQAFGSWVEAIAAIAGRDGADPAEALRTGWTVVTLLEGGLILARARQDHGPLEAARADAVAAARRVMAERQANSTPAR
jgi:TetR/AcrR family transcriptional repressor of lmrAB and yxaGH operons